MTHISSHTAPALQPGASAINRSLLLWHWGQAGAGSKYTAELAGELRRIPGIQTTVSAAEGSDLEALAEAMDGITLTTVRTFRGHKQSLAGKLAALGGLLGLARLGSDFRRSLAASRADVVICTMQSIWDLAAFRTLRRHANQFVLVLHDAHFHPGDNYPGRTEVLRREIDAADALIVLSDHVGQAAQRDYGFPADRIWTIPHGAFSFGDGAAAPRKLPADCPVRLLFIGRIAAYKGLGLLIATYRQLREQGVAVELEIVGSGDMEPYRAGLDGLPDVSVTNRWVDEDDIAAALGRADIVVLPYVEASQSGVAASALTAGIPMVATPVGGLAEQVRHGETGVIASEVSAGALGTAIRSLAEDPVLYERCSVAALEFVQRELGWTGIAKKFADVVERVLAMPRRHGR
jgi:glycosyltransferase involved in cell wall biosynthesis